MADPREHKNLEEYNKNTGVQAIAVAPYAVAIPAGAQGAVVDFSLKSHPICNAGGTDVGDGSDSSLAISSGVVFTTLVNFKYDDKLAEGEYYVDHLTGRGRGKKATSGTTQSWGYNVFATYINGMIMGDPGAPLLPFVDPTANGQLLGVTSGATQMPSVAAKMVKFVTHPNNAGNFYIGSNSGLTVPTLGAANNTTAGIPISPDRETGWFILKSGNLNELYFRADNTNDVMCYLIES